MIWLDLAIAARHDAERAFFDVDGVDAPDQIPRLQLADFSEFELAHLGMLIGDGYTPELVLDGDAPEEIVTACDPSLVDALHCIDDGDIPSLAARWQQASGLADAEARLRQLRDFARRAVELRLPLLYAQGDDRPPGDFD